jgi:septal ring-binding cell division protein DamX
MDEISSVEQAQLSAKLDAAAVSFIEGNASVLTCACNLSNAGKIIMELESCISRGGKDWVKITRVDDHPSLMHAFNEVVGKLKVSEAIQPKPFNLNTQVWSFKVIDDITFEKARTLADLVCNFPGANICLVIVHPEQFSFHSKTNRLHVDFINDGSIKREPKLKDLEFPVPVENPREDIASPADRLIKPRKQLALVFLFGAASLVLGILYKSLSDTKSLRETTENLSVDNNQAQNKKNLVSPMERDKSEKKVQDGVKSQQDGMTIKKNNENPGPNLPAGAGGGGDNGEKKDLIAVAATDPQPNLKDKQSNTEKAEDEVKPNVIEKGKKISVSAPAVRETGADVTTNDVYAGDAWARALKPPAWLAQHAALESYGSAQDWINKRQGLAKAKIVKVKSRKNNKIYYVVVSGPYINLEAARAAAKKLGQPESWIRGVRSLQGDLI